MNVDRSMRSVLNGIDVYPGASFMRHADQHGDRIDRPQSGGGGTKGYQSRLAFQGFPEGLKVQGAVFGMEIHPPDSAASVFGCHDPGSDIGVVIHASDDDLIPGLPGTSDGAAHGESQAGL